MSTPLPLPTPCCRQGSQFGYCEPFWVAAARRNRLTPRQLDVARGLVARKTEYQISRALKIAESTVHSRVLSLSTKLEAIPYADKSDTFSNVWRANA